MFAPRYNIRGLVIDPYNELDHTRPFESETEYVSQMLSKVKKFAQVRCTDTDVQGVTAKGYTQPFVSEIESMS